jgi:hypothetical protein
MKMLSYVKHILSRVSFDARLFEKELRKAIKMLIAEELQELQRWCYANYRRTRSDFKSLFCKSLTFGIKNQIKKPRLSGLIFYQRN